ncbi:heterogeneous nuclear ribonucleoprotein U-like protein 2 isoform X2 [Agrilus planipennis]|uniref:Heterogeneous nuclear ribonucleoprotein U-like protein 2 isoform X2 n=1 Tax=Agrilus planipennis TaxID=224129 RepID=A0A7F5QYZ8_AGRPL|nr:heterogeneous nuclear ribonucleoprotein U-like protein 2 isoform X2 [Agrilus planipennis]
MSSTIDPAKLKVVELRSELTARGLDTKGNKAVLVKRLKDALEKELQQEIPDTSIIDTSTEELNTSQESIPEADNSQNDEPAKKEEEEEELSIPEDVEMREEAESKVEEPEISKSNKEEEKNQKQLTENGESSADVEVSKDAVEESKEPETTKTRESEKEKEPRGEKRARSPSPGNAPPKRTRSPVKEDEPQIDNDKVQLSWYDCDLHLNIDKQSFLSAKPYHEGAFGYAWAGARTTHGISSGKARYEVKITESLKWEEIIKPLTKRELKKRSHKSSSRKDDHRKGESKKGEDTKKESSDEKNEVKNGNQEPAEEKKMEVDEEKPDETDNKQEENKHVEQKQKAEDKEEENKDVKQKGKAEDKEEENKDVKQKEKAEDKEEENKDVKQKEKAEDKEEQNKDVKQKEKAEDKEEDEVIEPLVTHLIRVGWSVADTGLQLGENKNSFAYESSGKFVVGGKFTDFGTQAAVGDVIGAYIDITTESVTFSFTVNGQLQPTTETISRSELPEENFALFPHVLSKNYTFEINLGTNEEPWYPNPSELEDYKFIHEVEDKVSGPVRPEKREECEVVMMCGLPASGKTYWAKQWISDNADKKYTLIGNSHLLERMTINGKPLKNRYQGRWNTVMDKINRCVNTLVKAASVRRRNYILDQTNILPSAQRDKMRLFEGFKRRAVIVVVTDEEQAKREAQQEAQGGKDLPELAVLEMKAMMGLPRNCDWLNEVKYAELKEEEARAMVQKYNKQGKDAGFKPFPDRKDNRYPLNKWDHNSSRRFQGGYNRHHNYNRGSWNNRRPPSGSWNQDVRNRGPAVRDWGRQQNRGPRDNRSTNYNRNQRSSSGGGSWQGSGGGGSWQGQGQGSNWNNSSNQGWSGSSNWSGQGQWKSGSYGSQGSYGQDYGQGYSNYSNWDYYRPGGYDQGWSSQSSSQYPASGYGDNYGQYQSNSWSQGGGKYNRK